jgi:hypothetical protein
MPAAMQDTLAQGLHKAFPAVNQLAASDEPSVRYKTRTLVLAERDDEADRALAREVRRSPRVQRVLSERDASGRIPHHPYAKWLGAHWVLATLADLGYPPGDQDLVPLREQVLDWLLDPAHDMNRAGVPWPAERPRIHASQEANAVWALIRLGLDDARVGVLVQRLLDYQWPDGGWNCDRKPRARVSSFHETLLPLRALSLYGRTTGSAPALAAARDAAEVFLERRLFLRKRDGAVMSPRFLKLHYPWYWQYDVLGGLVAMTETGFVRDPRCAAALDWLASRRLADGGWPADGRHYSGPTGTTGRSLVSWGPTGATRSNEWVTVAALYVLVGAGRLSV